MSDDEKSAWDHIPSLALEMDDDYDERLNSREQRRHERADRSNLKMIIGSEKSSFRIRVATASQGIFDGQILDISESGCQIAIPKKLSEDELIKVKFFIKEDPVISKAIIRWVGSTSRYHKAGVEFVKLPPDTKELLGAISSASLFNKNMKKT
jgi:hypothetical protein